MVDVGGELVAHLIDWPRHHNRLIAAVYLVAVPLAIVTIAILGAVEHYQSRAETRHAIVLIGHADCSASYVFERAALASTKSAGDRAKIRRFFHDYTAPINEALLSLGADPCKEEK